MRKLLLIVSLCLSLLAVGMVGSSAVLAAALKTVTLTVDKMTCNICPFTVKKALRKIEGVTNVVAKYEGEGDGWAEVTYDPDIVDIDDLTFTTEEAGYPSRLKK